LLALDKPVGITSHDLVLRVRRALKLRAVGHLGTLDPGASGLVLCALGPCTRAAQVWQGGEKTYQGTLRLGVVTDTQDLSGRVLAEHAVEASEARVRETAARFVGELQQVPPMVSALRREGRRLYELARAGIEVERPPRPVRVYALDIVRVELPRVDFTVRCSTGTYVRTLAHDLGEALGCGAALESLRRLRSEPFGLERALPGDRLEPMGAQEVLARGGYTLPEALAHLPTLDLDPAQSVEIGLGAAPRVDPGALPIASGPLSVVLRGSDGWIAALGELVPEEGTVRARPHLVFPWAVREGRV
jgi:tRNA pseudouridine55 synthase